MHTAIVSKCTQSRVHIHTAPCPHTHRFMSRCTQPLVHRHATSCPHAQRLMSTCTGHRAEMHTAIVSPCTTPSCPHAHHNRVKEHTTWCPHAHRHHLHRVRGLVQGQKTCTGLGDLHIRTASCPHAHNLVSRCTPQSCQNAHRLWSTFTSQSCPHAHRLVDHKNTAP